MSSEKSALKLKNIYKLLKDAFILLRQNDPLILASSTAFFTTFALSPIIIIIVNVLGLTYKSETISSQLFKSIEGTVGPEAAQQLESIVKNMRSLESNQWIAVGGFVFFIFVGTTLLHVIKQAIHQVWNIKIRSSKKLRYNLRERIRSIAMILFIGLLFVASILLDASIAFFRDYLHNSVSVLGTAVIRVLNIAFSVLVVTAWFIILFKVLPEARVKWKVALAGGILTGILFNMGKLILGKLLVSSNIITVFGASASIALLLLFIFYASFIIYYGAAFTYKYAEATKKPIHAGKYADEYEEVIIENVKSGVEKKPGTTLKQQPR